MKKRQYRPTTMRNFSSAPIYATHYGEVSPSAGITKTHKIAAYAVLGVLWAIMVAVIFAI